MAAMRKAVPLPPHLIATFKSWFGCNSLHAEVSVCGESGCASCWRDQDKLTSSDIECSTLNRPERTAVGHERL